MQVQREAELLRPALFSIPPPVPYYESLMNLEARERASRSVAEEQLYLQRVEEDARHLFRLEQLKL
jgi:hypothetical protein